ncbi:predicted protein [Paecilomyces variotii No. 5]|uniref:DUF7730 domain-containing protein n=1 Tax=Byssochlamys spectabilis (strain No. 5 / NBRC 109023) TaxID=1356009 RepID=V5FVE7_BYSSN|nr:predicted protein [Paecilomyces variotii No. 5]
MCRPVGNVCPPLESSPMEQNSSNTRGRGRGREGGRGWGGGRGRGRGRGRGGRNGSQEIWNLTQSQSSTDPQKVQNTDNQNHTGRPRGTDRDRGRAHARRGYRGNKRGAPASSSHVPAVIDQQPAVQSNANASARQGKDAPERGNRFPRHNRPLKEKFKKDDPAKKPPVDKGKAPMKQHVASRPDETQNERQTEMQHSITTSAKDPAAPILQNKVCEPSGTVLDTQCNGIEYENMLETSSIQVEFDGDVLAPVAPVSRRNMRIIDQPIQQNSLFFQLPGEIRTKIYEYVFGTYRVNIYRSRVPNTESSKRQYRLRHTRLPHYHHKIHDLMPRKKSPPAIPSALVYTCWDVYRETALFLYSNTQFVFRSTKAINLFLKNTPIVAQNAIRHLELNYIGYNEPRLTEFRKFKIRSDMTWYLACSAMAQNFTSLRVLHLHITIWDWPMKLDLKERWAIPLLVFARKGGLEYVDAILRMHMFNNDQLREAARKLEKALMNPRTYQIKDDRRLAMQLQGPVKAGKVLNVVF